jgi:cell wall-associated NlpC family hydrolase
MISVRRSQPHGKMKFILYNHALVYYIARMRRSRLTIVSIAFLLLPCAAIADEAGEPPAFVQTASATSAGMFGQAQELVLRAMSFIGVRYKWGGDSPDSGFDCSGLIRYVYNQVTGRTLPGNAREISRVGETVDAADLQPGDLVFFNTLRRPFSHVGIYLGESRFVHAPSRGGQVEIVDMNTRYWKSRYNGARRLAN